MALDVLKEACYSPSLTLLQPSQSTRGQLSFLQAPHNDCLQVPRTISSPGLKFDGLEVIKMHAPFSIWGSDENTTCFAVRNTKVTWVVTYYVERFYELNVDVMICCPLHIFPLSTLISAIRWSPELIIGLGPMIEELLIYHRDKQIARHRNDIMRASREIQAYYLALCLDSRMSSSNEELALLSVNCRTTCEYVHVTSWSLGQQTVQLRIQFRDTDDERLYILHTLH